LKITIASSMKLSGVPGDLMQTLTRHFQMLNPKWLENERMGRWNRGTKKTLRFYRRFGKQGIIIPRGYARQLIRLLNREHVAYTLDDQRRLLPAVSFDFSGSLKSFQTVAVDAMLKREFGTLSAPTGSGKTIMGLYLIAQRRQPTIIIVHTKDLAHQWIQRIEQFLGIPADQVGLLGAGKKRMGDRITVALVQTLYRMTDQVAPLIGHIVVDECHRAPSRTFTEAVTAFDARYMLGLSATPWRRDKLSRLIFWYLGDVNHEVNKAQLEQKGHILKADVVLRPTTFEPYFDPVNDYSRMLSELTTDDARNHLIAEDVEKEARSGEGICLVLSDRKKHCETLQSILRYKHGLESERLTGDLSIEARKQVMEKIQKGQVNVLIATGQLIGEGFDCPDLSTLFLATPIRFSGRVTQYLGRILRPSRHKARARVYDYVDVQVAPLMAAARARQRVYGGEDGALFRIRQ
jgi:superfamily II DNA or RNA helicase